MISGGMRKRIEGAFSPSHLVGRGFREKVLSPPLTFLWGSQLSKEKLIIGLVNPFIVIALSDKMLDDFFEQLLTYAELQIDSIRS